jgi:single-stranded DNA-binding protein
MFNQVNLMGRLTADPDLKTSASGKASVLNGEAQTWHGYR